MKLHSYLFVILITCLALVSCSSKGTVVMPEPEEFMGDVPSVSGTKNPSETNGNPYRNLFGAWKVRLDPESMLAELIPARNALAIGDIFDADLSQFLTVSPCANCLRISSFNPTGISGIELGLQIKHPFSNLASRPDLHGFDVRAIFIAPTYTFPFPDISVVDTDGLPQVADVSFSFLGNADGFTSHYDELVSDERYFIGGEDVPGNLNPFLRFYDDPDETAFDPFAPSGHNVMPVGSSYYERLAILSNPYYDEPLEFFIIADVAYGQSATYLNRPDPQYYLPWFNRTEPWRMEYWIENNNLSDSDPGSTADIVIQVFDWQHGATVDPGFPDPANLSGIPSSSDVLQLELSVPSLQDTLLIETTPESGTGSPTDPLQYRFTVTNVNGATVMSRGFVAIRDETNGLAYPDGRMAIPVLPAGFPYETRDIRDYSLYDIVWINIPMSTSPPSEWGHELDLNDPDQFAGSMETSILAWHFMDGSLAKFRYFWDYDYDGITFSEDGEGLPSPLIQFATPGIKNVGLKVETNSVPPRELIYGVPVYAEGTVFETNFSPSASMLHSTSLNRNNSVAMTSENYYIVYTSEEAGERDVWLAIMDKQGNSQSINLTQNILSHNYGPSICVVEDGVNDGIYISYLRRSGLATSLHSTFGNLDGSGFELSNHKEIAAGIAMTLRHENAIFHKNGSLFSYHYYYNSMIGGKIKVSSSSDMGLTWSASADINTTPSPGPYYTPAFTYNESSGYMYAVWVDSRDFATNGSDLYMAYSSNMVSFTDGENISMIRGNLDELYPSASIQGAQLAVAYLIEDASGYMDAHLMVLNPVSGPSLDYVIHDALGTSDATYPAIYATGEDRFVYAYGKFNLTTNDLTCVVLDIDVSNSATQFNITQILSQSLGNVDPDGGQVFPCIASQKHLGGYVIENFVAWRSFADGNTYSATPFDWYFGQIEATSFITYGDINN